VFLLLGAGAVFSLTEILSPARFATVKKEQVQWLKKRDSASSVDEKHKLVEARIKALQELLW